MTPAYAAVDGALDKLSTLATGNVVNVLVFVTDGAPNDCCPAGDCNVAIGNLSQAAFLTYGIRTYTIGMAGANITALNSIAAKGGTGSAFVINGSDTAAVAAQLTAALTAIAGQSVSCDIALPANNLFDIQDSQVVYIAGGGSTSTIPQVTNSTMCGSGWYFDDNYNPTKITLCPTTCSGIKVDTSARVEIHLGCPKLYEPTSFQQAYTHSCPPGTVAQWGYLAYDATTPLDSYVEIWARTADTKDGLAAQPWTALTVAKTASGNSVCPMNAGTALCPVDLYQKLGLPAGVRPWIELKETANPSYNGRWPSTLNSWEMTFSCPAAE